MRMLPNIPGTVANYPFNGSLVDISGNALNLSVFTGSALYETFDACTLAFTFDGTNGATSLIAPLSTLYQLPGELTVQFILLSRATFVQSIIGADEFGGSIALWAFYVDNQHNIDYSDYHINTNMTTGNLWVGYEAAGLPIAFAFRKRQTSPGHFLSEAFANGVLIPGGGVATTTETAAGTERLVIGDQYGGGSTPLRGAMANLRIVNYARTDAEILADANLTFSGCAVPLTYRGIDIRMETST